MYNSKDIQFVGKHDYDRSSAENYAKWISAKTFSVNIFQWVLKSDGKTMKRSKGKVRVYGYPAIKDKVFDVCDQVVKDLDNDQWDGRKTVSVN